MNYENGESRFHSYYRYVPWVIPIEWSSKDLFGPLTYVVKIPLENVDHKAFLILGIHSRYEIRHIEILQSDTIHFSSPGWFIYDNHDFRFDPPVLIPELASNWFLRFSPTDDYLQPKIYQFAIIGRKADPIK